MSVEVEVRLDLCLYDNLGSSHKDIGIIKWSYESVNGENIGMTQQVNIPGLTMRRGWDNPMFVCMSQG